MNEDEDIFKVIDEFTDLKNSLIYLDNPKLIEKEMNKVFE